jgi:glycosyltransferase involved in cell wall biosynthesis
MVLKYEKHSLKDKIMCETLSILNGGTTINILVFSIHYPNNANNSKVTSVVHYFTREWVKLGHRVVVVHNYIQLWEPYRVLFRNFDNDKPYIREVNNYEIEGVKVLLVPVTKYIPKSRHIFSRDAMRTKDKIISFLKRESFKPDLFIIHFCDEQWKIVEAVKNYFDCKPVAVFHNCDVKYSKNVTKIVSSCGKIGVRSQTIKNRIEKIYGQEVKAFQVLSGAPDYIYDLPKIRNNDVLHKEILYVGNLIPLKKVDVTIKALAELKESYDFTFRIIGSGESEEELKQLVQKLNMSNNVIFCGRKPRAEVIDIMRRSDCFVMVSSPETFGITYIEAMASGCFIIGSKGEGIDGIIKNEFNGLLVSPNNVEELSSAFEHYFNMANTELTAILTESLNTAYELTESSVAKKYLEHIIS